MHFLSNAAPECRPDVATIRRAFSAVHVPLTEEGFRTYSSIYARLLSAHSQSYVSPDGEWDALVLALDDEPIFFEGEISAYVLDAADPHMSLLVREQRLVACFCAFDLSVENIKMLFNKDAEHTVECPWFQFRAIGYSTRVVPWRRVCYNSLLSRHSSEMVNGLPRKANFHAHVQSFCSDDRRDCPSFYTTPGGGSEPLLAKLRSLDLEDRSQFIQKFGDNME